MKMQKSENNGQAACDGGNVKDGETPCHGDAGSEGRHVERGSVRAWVDGEARRQEAQAGQVLVRWRRWRW